MRTEIEDLNFDTEKLEAYEKHLKKRLDLQDHREQEVKEKERTELHNAVLDSVEPKDLDYRAHLVLSDYIEKKLGSSLIGFLEVNMVYEAHLNTRNQCPLCDKPIKEHGKHGECPT